MTPLKLTRTGRNRLFKLIAFLEKLERKRFDFSKVVSDFDRKHNCGAVCCAVGWMPSVFPRLVEWDDDYYVKVIGERSPDDYSEAAAVVFGLPGTIAADLFAPDGQRDVHRELPQRHHDATPRQVARMLRKFITLADAGKIAC